MFKKQTFSNILKKINDSYPTMSDFASKASFDRTYISKYINQKLDNPPSPKILEKIAKASKNITTYSELMEVCGYLENISPNPSDKIFRLLGIASYDGKIITNDILAEIKEKKLSKEDIINIVKLISEYLSEHDTKKELDLYSFTIDNKIILSDNVSNVIKKHGNSLIYLYSKFKNENDSNVGIACDFCDFLNVRLDSNTFPAPSNKLYMCPVYGRIAAGVPNWAEQCMEGTLPLDPDMMHITNPEECFFLRVSGESMNKVIKNGGYALIRKQEDVENGEIAVVLVNGYDATLKKFTKKDNMIILEPMSDDATFQIQLYGPDTPIQILGKYIGKFEMN